MIEAFVEWFLSQSKFERVMFVVDVILLLAFLSALQDFFNLLTNGCNEVIL